MAATMNVFEYFHYMTSFIDELVEKHGYDRDVIVNAWRSQNKKWMTLENEKSKAAIKPKKTSSKKDGVTEKCSFILQRGKNKGNACGKNVIPGTHTCKCHTSNVVADEKIFIESEDDDNETK